MPNPIDGGDKLKKVILLIGFMASVLVLSPVLAQLPGEQKMGLDVKWYFNSSAAFPGVSFGAGHQGCFSVYDVDGDGSNEIYYGTRRGDSKRMWCLNPDATIKWIFPPLGEDGLPGDPTTKPSFVDVNNDGTYEICFAGRGGVLWVLKPDGSILWRWDNPNPGEAMHGAPQAWDVDGDGNVEFFMNDNPGFIHRISNTGELIWTSAQAGAGNQGHPTIADIDRDDAFELLYASQDNNLYCISADTGQEEWRFDTGENQQTNQVMVADVNKDGEFEAITWTDGTPPSSGKVYIVSFYGTELGRWTVPYEGINIRICQAMGDVDGDGNMEMALNTGCCSFVIDVGTATPTTEWEANLSALSVAGVLPEGALNDHWSSYQLIADIDADGAQEILWLAPYPIVTDAATGALEGYYVNDYIAVSRRQENGAWWGDVDQDGVSEWICELNGPSHPETMVYALTMGGAFPADAWWPEYYHCALPNQAEASWLKLQAPYSNSMWFPMPEVLLPSVGLLLFGLLWRRK
jgi:hypothetical protein